MKDFENAIDGLFAVALAVYLAMVVIRGNTKPFLAMVVTEAGLIEFLVALFILSQLARIPEAKPIVVPLATASGVILAIRIVQGANMNAFSDFAAGRIGLWGLVSGVFGNQA